MTYSAQSNAIGLVGPIVIGGTGGSGTRTVAEILLRSGIFLGPQLNESLDTLSFAQFYRTRHIELFEQMDSGVVDTESDSCLEFERITGWLRGLLPKTACGWGFKNPRTIYFLEILNRLLPDMKFIHVVRDGRDMAFSDNQSSVEDYGPVIFKGETFESLQHMSIALWARINMQAASYSGQKLPDRYLRIRFEDLCERPEAEISKILDFSGIDSERIPELAQGIRKPGSIGRWKRQDAVLVGEILRLGESGLRYFDYIP